MQSTHSVNTHQSADKDICRFHLPACQPYAEFFSLQEHEVIERKQSATPRSLNNHCAEFLIPGIHFMLFSYDVAQKGETIFRSSEPYISMVFSIKNGLTYINQNEIVFAELGHNEQQLIFISNQQTHLKWESERGGEIFIINLTIDYFKRFIAENHPLHTVFESSVYENTPAALIEQKLSITPKMLSLLYDIAQCDYKKEYKRLFLKSKVIELLMLQFEMSENALQAEETDLLKNVNIEKMHLARQIITSNLSQSCSIVDLAQQIGTNDCYLKKHFKQVFGTTVYGYLQKERMEKSKELLLEGDRKISEVARLSGYKHASHFTTAFKKYFGYLPNKIKIAVLSIFCEPEIMVLLEMPGAMLAA